MITAFGEEGTCIHVRVCMGDPRKDRDMRPILNGCPSELREYFLWFVTDEDACLESRLDGSPFASLQNIYRQSQNSPSREPMILLKRLIHSIQSLVHTGRLSHVRIKYKWSRTRVATFSYRLLENLGSQVRCPSYHVS
jgi:hypothetical protein